MNTGSETGIRPPRQNPCAGHSGTFGRRPASDTPCTGRVSSWPVLSEEGRLVFRHSLQFGPSPFSVMLVRCTPLQPSSVSERPHGRDLDPSHPAVTTHWTPEEHFLARHDPNNVQSASSHHVLKHRSPSKKHIGTVFQCRGIRISGIGSGSTHPN